MDYKTVWKALETKLGCRIEPGGNHYRCRLFVDDVYVGWTTLPYSRKRPVGGHWLRNIMEAMYIDSATELREYGKCRRSYQEFVSKLKASGVI
jgi:hypothetical protein